MEFVDIIRKHAYYPVKLQFPVCGVMVTRDFWEVELTFESYILDLEQKW